MSRAAKLDRQIGKNVAESIGATDRPPLRVADPPAEAQAARPRARLDDATFRVPLGLLDPDPDQPRKAFDEAKLAELAASLKASGQLQACLVRPAREKGRFVLVCGERRLRAARLAGIAELLCRQEAGRGPAELLADQLAENLLRDDLNPVDLSESMVKLQGEFGWSTRAIAARLGVSQSSVARSIALAGLDEPLRERVRDGRLAPSVAILIARLPGPAQVEMAVAVQLEKLSRDDVEERVRAILEPEPEPPAPASHRDSSPPVIEVGRGPTEPPPAAEPATLVASPASPKPAAGGDLPGRLRHAGPTTATEDFFGPDGRGLVFFYDPKGDAKLGQFDELVHVARRRLAAEAKFSPGTRVRVAAQGTTWHGYRGTVLSIDRAGIDARVELDGSGRSGTLTVPVAALVYLGKADGKKGGPG